MPDTQTIFKTYQLAIDRAKRQDPGSKAYRKSWRKVKQLRKQLRDLRSRPQPC